MPNGDLLFTERTFSEFCLPDLCRPQPRPFRVPCRAGRSPLAVRPGERRGEPSRGGGGAAGRRGARERRLEVAQLHRMAARETRAARLLREEARLVRAQQLRELLDPCLELVSRVRVLYPPLDRVLVDDLELAHHVPVGLDAVGDACEF